MAKKKANPQPENKPLKPQDQIHHPNHQMMDDVTATEKLDSLKSLNAKLLKEMVERRQQIDSLIHSNGVFESELNRSKMDKVLLQSELDELADRAVVLEIEKGLVSAVVGLQVNQLVEVGRKQIDGFCRERMAMEERIGSLEREMERVLKEKEEIESVKKEKELHIGSLSNRLEMLVDEIGREKLVSLRVCEERDDIRAELDARILEEEGMRLKLIEAGKREAGIAEELERLKSEYHSLVEEKAVGEARMELILKEKDSVHRSLVESNGLVDELKREIELIVREKAVIEEEKDILEQKKDELQISVSGLNELVLSLQKQEDTLLERAADLEKRCVESSENEVKMGMEISRLLEDKKEQEGNFQRLTEDKSLVKKELEEALEMLDHQKLTVERLAQEKSDIEDAKWQGEKDIVKLKEQLGEYKDNILSLEKSSMSQIEKLKQLEAEVCHFQAAFDQATTERNDARESLNEEKITVNNLREKVSKMGKDMEDVCGELAKMAAVNGKVLGEKNELESRCAVLMKDMASVESKLADTKTEFDDVKAKLGVAEDNLKLVLNLLKNTSLICQSKEDENRVIGLAEGNGFGEEMNQYVMEMEAIQRAFKDREGVVQDMKRQLELLKDIVAKEHKGKSFWTMVSSATTLLAAASLAYVARCH